MKIFIVDDHRILAEGIEGMLKAGEPEDSEDSLPDVPGSRLAPDGQHYVQHPNGQYMRVEANVGTAT